MSEEELRKTIKDCVNELCLYCGQYKNRHLGACDGCRWMPLQEPPVIPREEGENATV